MDHLKNIRLDPYDRLLDPTVTDVTPSGLEVIRRRNPSTGQVISLLGSPHPEHDPDHPIYNDIEQEWDYFNALTEGRGGKEVVCEGRTPMMTLGGVLLQGQRPPVVDAANRSEVIRRHGDLGIIARLGRLGCLAVKSAEMPGADRVIALHLTVNRGFKPPNIMRFYTYRQIPNWANAYTNTHPPLKEYLEQEVVARYRSALQADWPTFDFSLDNALSDYPGLLAHARDTPNPELAKHFIQQTFNITGTPRELTSVPRVARAYNKVRTSHFAFTLTHDWGHTTAPHRFALVGKYHLRAMTTAMAKLGSTISFGQLVMLLHKGSGH